MPRFASLDTVDPKWAWAPYEPSRETPWNLERASHLYRRAAYGGTWTELQEAVKAGPHATLDKLAPAAEDAATATFYHQADGMAHAVLAGGDSKALPPWWLYVMRFTPHPLRERMTLFWHGHFATSGAKVTKSKMMYRQNELLREHALGSFGELAQGISKDAAMLVWLDSAVNRKAHPNENYAREVMELFCLGLGAYTEKDIQEAARAFTGWEVRGERFFFNARQHDDKQKTLLSRQGNWNGDDVVRILLEQPACGMFLCGKIYRYLVSDASPPTALLAPLAEEYKSRQYDTLWLARTMLQSNLFFSEHALRQRIKSPVDLAIGLLRQLEGTTNFVAAAEDLRQQGQDVFFPPNVKGWDGGADWINSASLLGRANLVWGMVGGQDDRYGRKIRLDELLARHGVASGAESTQFLCDLLLGMDVPAETRVQLAAVATNKDGDAHLQLARVAQAVTALPEFQLA